MMTNHQEPSSSSSRLHSMLLNQHVIDITTQDDSEPDGDDYYDDFMAYLRDTAAENTTALFRIAVEKLATEISEDASCTSIFSGHAAQLRASVSSNCSIIREQCELDLEDDFDEVEFVLNSLTSFSSHSRNGYTMRLSVLLHQDHGVLTRLRDLQLTASIAVDSRPSLHMVIQGHGTTREDYAREDLLHRNYTAEEIDASK